MFSEEKWVDFGDVEFTVLVGGRKALEEGGGGGGRSEDWDDNEREEDIRCWSYGEAKKNPFVILKEKENTHTHIHTHKILSEKASFDAQQGTLLDQSIITRFLVNQKYFALCSANYSHPIF